MNIGLNPKERQLIIDACEDTLYRHRYDRKVEKNKIYINAIKRLKSKIQCLHNPDWWRTNTSSPTKENEGDKVE